MASRFFARYKTTIDYHAHQMSFEPIDYHVRDLFAELPDRLMGPKVARQRVLAPSGLWGLSFADPAGGLESPGMPIARVHADSPAARGGLKVGDVMISLDGRWTTSTADVYQAAGDVKPGRETTVVVIRDGKEVTCAVTPVDGA